jgi:hypothetical protein
MKAIHSNEFKKALKVSENLVTEITKQVDNVVITFKQGNIISLVINGCGCNSKTTLFNVKRALQK